MIYKYFSSLFNNLIVLIDHNNKKKIVKFFKKNLQDKSLIVIDVGAHKGETIDLFLKNFSINKIYSFEPNLSLFKKIESNKKYQRSEIEIFNKGVGTRNEVKNLNIMVDTSSSTIHSLNEDTKYYQRKKRILSLFNNTQNFISGTQKINIINFSDFMKDHDLKKINILKIDTEGYEFYALKGIREKDFLKIKYIYFEHHYDLMIKKEYKFSDIHNLLIQNSFKSKLKIRMKFRKSFEYIYENLIYKND